MLKISIEPGKPELETLRHHPVFYKFRCWRGTVPQGYIVDFLGVLTNASFFVGFENKPSAYVETTYPSYSDPTYAEEYFEWIDLLEAVTAAQSSFTMIELGAGFGRWTMAAAAAVRQYSGIPSRFVAVEAEPTHFRWISEHLQSNAINLDSVQLYEAAVSDADGVVGFHVSEGAQGGPSGWYGQAIGGPTSVKAISLASLLMPLESVDLIDVDIQGAELQVLQAADVELDRKVKRIHIGTHNGSVERGLRSLFSRLGWIKLRDYPCGEVTRTEYGNINFQDGVQSWINPKLFSPELLSTMTSKHVFTSLGFSLQLDARDFITVLLEQDEIFEAPETDLVTRLVRPGDVCLDAGCQVGYYSCLLAYSILSVNCRKLLRCAALTRLPEGVVLC